MHVKQYESYSTLLQLFKNPNQGLNEGVTKFLSESTKIYSS